MAAAVGFQFDVIPLDIGLPRWTGYEACRHIQGQSGGEELVIIAETGWGQEEDRQRTHEAGFDHHLVKPVGPSALMKLLAELQVAKERKPFWRKRLAMSGPPPCVSVRRGRGFLKKGYS